MMKKMNQEYFNPSSYTTAKVFVNLLREQHDTDFEQATRTVAKYIARFTD
jgi:hypothetical protein